ncbi:phosphohexomutase domain-containing protein [Desulfogranum mediterraneum]|uniref:phosphoglucomutase n=1 Tax=Desulfogranum mediterraneum TaxID=160661 RepID=UPI0003FD792C|nr:phosphoglucomutase [Desulfogranum mediterraneum]
MTDYPAAAPILKLYLHPDDHAASDYFSALKELVRQRNAADPAEARSWQNAIDEVYGQIRREILTNTSPPVNQVSFGTSGWRGTLGKDLTIHSVATVTCAILQLYRQGSADPAMAAALGGLDFSAMQEQGCVIGFDNRFGGELLALAAINILVANGVRVYYAGESTTGALSASVLIHKAAFSINLTPSHNPMEYGGVKYNAADGGPAAPILTDTITRMSRSYLQGEANPFMLSQDRLQTPLEQLKGVVREDVLASWQELVRTNRSSHGLDYDQITAACAAREELVVCVDAVHGASRDYLSRLLAEPPKARLILLRNTPDPTFGGIAPEPSSANIQPTMAALRAAAAPLKIGAIIDPDGDRIRFTDGRVEISMNQFGAMAYHFLHEVKGKRGMVAKTVASSNLANALAKDLGEEVFEPKVGFKEFKPVMGKALVYFEESDGISIIGHTPEKDAFIGLLLALDMVLTLNISLGAYLEQIEQEYGHFYPDRDGIVVSVQGEELSKALQQLERYQPGQQIAVGDQAKTIEEVIAIDGRKIIFSDGSWLMIRPSGTEPKVRFYVEARTPEETALLVKSAHSMLAECGLLPYS